MAVIFSNKKVAYILEWLVPILCFGYPIQVFIPFLLGTDTNAFNVAARVVYLGISLIIVFLTFFKTKNKFSIGVIFFILFWIVYALRLFYDLEILEIGRAHV